MESLQVLLASKSMPCTLGPVSTSQGIGQVVPQIRDRLYAGCSHVIVLIEPGESLPTESVKEFPETIFKAMDDAFSMTFGKTTQISARISHTYIPVKIKRESTPSTPDTPPGQPFDGPD